MKMVRRTLVAGAAVTAAMVSNAAAFQYYRWVLFFYLNRRAAAPHRFGADGVATTSFVRQLQKLDSGAHFYSTTTTATATNTTK